MNQLLRRNVVPVVFTITVATIVSSIALTSQAIYSQPTAEQHYFEASLQAQQLGTLRSNIGSATSRVRVLKMGGDEQDRLELAEAIARCGQTIGDLDTNAQSIEGTRFGQLHDDIADFLELLRTANDSSKEIDGDQLNQVRQHSRALRSRIESMEEQIRRNIKTLQSQRNTSRRIAFWTAMIGHVLILAASASLLLVRRMEMRRMQITSIDRTDRDNRFALVAQSTTDGMIVTDEMGRIEVANSTMAKLLNASPESLGGRILTDFFETTLIDEWLSGSLDGSATPSQLVRRVRVRRTDGTKFLAELSVTKTTSDFGECLVISVRDVSEHEASRLRMKRHEALLEEIPDPIHVLDSKG
ncbi:MAG: PAS domain-containing protein, partial [Planctomycetales bacterium]|nr:PAS domain-containing protein [Planctomycetales bacterium]